MGLVHRVMMVTDFFYPNVGGVENHVYQLSQQLLLLGHKVVIVTHAYGDCRGVRYLTNGLKVYYLHRRPMYQQTSMPTLFLGMPMLRHLLIRESITLVHAHQAFSTLGLEAILYARTMGYQVVFTDHSLFGFADASSILMNKLLKCVLADVGHAVCVSHTSRENTVLRACLPPARVSVIPNAVDMSVFRPVATDPSSSSSPHTQSHPSWPRDGLVDPVVVVLLSRLVYRKGLDLVALALPHVCATYPNITVIIGGGGTKAQLLEAVAAAHGLGDRVSLVGPVAPDQAAEFMRRGHIFLNASLTEAFCMAIVEAAACGLMVVSTRVGGVPEVLPPDMVELSEPSAEGLCTALGAALARVGRVDPHQQHKRVAGMYSWHRVAARTLAVYDLVATPPPQHYDGTTSRAAAAAAAAAATRDQGASRPTATRDKCLPSATAGRSAASKGATNGATRAGPSAPTTHIRQAAAGPGAATSAAAGSRQLGGSYPAQECAATQVGPTTTAAPQQLRARRRGTAAPAVGEARAVHNEGAGGGATHHVQQGTEVAGGLDDDNHADGPVGGGITQSKVQGEGTAAPAAADVVLAAGRGPQQATLLPAQLLQRLLTYVQCGVWAGPLFCTLIVWLHWWWCVLDWWLPPEGIEVAPDWPASSSMGCS